MSQYQKGAKTLAGYRNIRFRQAGDIQRDGMAALEETVIGENVSWAWIKGSHETAIRVKSHDGLVAIAGNPGRWGRPDNLFGLDLSATIVAANFILAAQSLPSFSAGNEYASQHDTCEVHYTGARVWSVHLTQNYATGSPENAKAVINWLDTQSVARVKKSRLGGSTVVWGSLKYCQTEAYIKADEMLAHAKGDEAKEAVRNSQTYKYALENGIVRVEVKAAKDYLKEKGLTYLGAWNMGTVHRIFAERTEVLHRVKADIEEFDIMHLPKSVRMTYAAWHRGEDVASLFANRMTLYRHAKALRAFGFDITEKRNIETFPVKVRTIDLVPLSPPEFYRDAA